MADAPRDNNYIPAILLESSTNPGVVLTAKGDEITGRLLVDNSGGGSGTVTSVSVTSANGFAGTVATATTTPAITLSTTITGIIKGNGTAISAATAGTDYTALAFKTIAVSGQSDVVADSAADTLTLVAGTNVTITTDAATDSITINASAGASGITIGTTTITSGTTTRILYDNAGVVGEYTITGTGTVVAMQTSPSLLTSLLMDSGFVMNWASSNVVLTHSAGILTLGTGTLKITNPTNTATSVVTIDGTQTLTNKSISGGQITSAVATATALANTRTIWGQNFDGTANVTGSLTAVTDITGGASNMIITSGTGVSRTLTLRTTTSGSVATAAITIDDTQMSTFGGDLTINAHNIITDTTTGIKIGTGTTQKIAFFNSTPIVKPSGDVTTALTNLGLVATPTINADTVASANEATDTTCFPLFITASGTQTLATKNNTNLTFDSSGAILGSTIINAGTGFRVAGAAASNKILKGNGTNFVASTETYAAPGTSGNVMTSDGTNWTSAAPGAPSGIGWALKAYTSGTSALPISISSLDLATDLSYKILYQIEITNSSTASSLRVTFNTVTTANYNTMYAYDRNGGGTYASGTNAGNGNSYITIQSNTMRSHFGEMNLVLTKDDGTNKRPRMECVNNGFTQSDLTVSFDRTRSVGWLDNATNITSVEIKELSVTGTPTYAWRVWVYKSTTS